MAVIGAFVFPHPPLAIPAVGRGGERDIQKTLDAFDKAAGEIAFLAPETIVFLTPHNILYGDYFHISPGAGAAGSFARFKARDERLEASYDELLAMEIASLAERGGIPAGYLGEKDSGLDHGVMVPMWFINRRYGQYDTVRVSQSGLGAAEHYRVGMCIAEAAEKTGRRVVIAASGDLSHKLAGSSYGTVPEGAEFDRAVTGALADGDFLALLSIPDRLRESAAECGYSSFVMMAGCFDCRKVCGKLYSYEGPFGVGYAVMGFTPGERDNGRNALDRYQAAVQEMARETQRSEDCWRALARQSLEHTVRNGGRLPLPAGLPGELLQRKAGVFVSLHKHGRLRGCIGTIMPIKENIALEIIHNAVSAGLSDNRFDPVDESELPYLVYKVDVLSPPEPVNGPKELDVRRYGVIVTSGHKRGLLLPNLEGVRTVEEQISIARQKAGIREGADIKLERFEVVRHE